MVNKDKKNMVKSRLLVMSKMFYEMTDEDHKMDTFEIIDFLAEKGVPANTKTLRSDIALLKQHGMDIITVPGRPNKYFCGSRLFDIPELKLLIDAVNSSRFITDKKSKILNRKLLSTVSEYQRKQLKRSVYSTEKIKPKNEKIFYMVDTINNGIQIKHQIRRSLTGSCGIYASVLFSMCCCGDLHNAVVSGIGSALRYYRNRSDFADVISDFEGLEKIETWGEDQISGSGYVVHTLQAALWCLMTTSGCAECVLKAVNLGEDTDTTAAVAGSMAGLWYNYNKIPKNWLEMLPKKQEIEKLCKRFAYTCTETW